MDKTKKILVRKNLLPQALLKKFNTQFAGGIPFCLRKTIPLGKAQKVAVVEWKTDSADYLVILDRPKDKGPVQADNATKALQYLLEDKEQGETFAQVRDWQDSLEGENIAEDS